MKFSLFPVGEGPDMTITTRSIVGERSQHSIFVPLPRDRCCSMLKEFTFPFTDSSSSLELSTNMVERLRNYG